MNYFLKKWLKLIFLWGGEIENSVLVLVLVDTQDVSLCII